MEIYCPPKTTKIQKKKTPISNHDCPDESDLKIEILSYQSIRNVFFYQIPSFHEGENQTQNHKEVYTEVNILYNSSIEKPHYLEFIFCFSTSHISNGRKSLRSGTVGQVFRAACEEEKSWSFVFLIFLIAKAQS